MGESSSESSSFAYEVVLEVIEQKLRSGELSIGDRLPSERSMAAEFNLSRASVRDAIRILGVLGLVRSSTGSGPNSGTIIISEPVAGLAAALRLHVASRGLAVKEIVRTRIILETGAALEAVIDDSPETLAKLAQAHELLARMDDPKLDRNVFHELDTQFHVLLTSLSGNAVLEAMMESVRVSVRDYVANSITTDEAWLPLATELRHQHHGILDAFESNQLEDAARLLRSHIEWFYGTATEDMKQR
ncbi:DNA-binding FadR family transcriptional regulator [Neomicrococcus aestuarii]|uniref:DNA-binding FadR family transcriptional regulator n=1 Tax=Neomicrococcus aestuarii TaxID=556325 RepID=A0A7W8WYS9_9MICC|nr:FCD domain-containing protein [Neomicrococcus aestuarii]MBB5512646.1 DNA-binding FadR family transcriptional regulator [Neomicrococcus aestuarii]